MTEFVYERGEFDGMGLRQGLGVCGEQKKDDGNDMTAPNRMKIEATQASNLWRCLTEVTRQTSDVHMQHTRDV